MAGNFFESIYNFPSTRLKIYMSEILKDRYFKHEQTLEKLGPSLSQDKDIQAFAELIVEVYEIGYLKALTDYEKEISKLGYNVKIVPPERPKETTKIFKE